MKELAIVGGGIAGLATGISALARGLRVRLYDDGPHPNAGHGGGDGHLIWLAANGLHLLADLGVYDQVAAKGCDQRAMHFSQIGLQPLVSLATAGLKSQLGYGIIAITRRELHQILFAAFQQRGGQAFYHMRLAPQVSGQQLILRDAAGNLLPPADWLVAADGIGSAIRRSLMPASRVIYQGFRTFLGSAVKPQLAARLVGETHEIWSGSAAATPAQGPGAAAAVGGCSRPHGADRRRLVLTSLDGRRVYFSAIEAYPTYEGAQVPVAPGTNSRLAAAFAGFGPEVVELLAAADNGELRRHNFSCVKGMATYAHRQVAFVGDAAHGMPPNMGQGASLALEDAVELVAAISSNQDLAAWDKRRRRRGTKIMTLANQMNRMFAPRSRLGCWLRDRAAQLTPNAYLTFQAQRLYRVPPPGHRQRIWPQPPKLQAVNASRSPS